MLEKYEKNFDANEFIKKFMEINHEKSEKAALSLLRKAVPKESYYQDKVRQALKKKYPDGFTRKIAQGMYSESGIPDILFIYEGHYFGFEIKRPVLGELAPIQNRTIRLIRGAGGTAEVVSWPEQAIEAVEKWRKENEKPR